MSDNPLSYANFSNLSQLEAWYEAYKKDPQSLEAPLRAFFQGFDLARSQTGSSSGSESDLKVYRVIDLYRRYGHLSAHCNPLSPAPKELPSSALQLSKEALSSLVPANTWHHKPPMTLQELITSLEKIYCKRIGFEYMHIANEEIKTFIQHAIEQTPTIDLSRDEKQRACKQLLQAELFETFLHTKYTGQKRFSLEGCETLIPLLDTLLETAAILNVQETVIGMSHRGRLNVLANILGKSYQHIFQEFEDRAAPIGNYSGDVKYHKGFIGKRSSSSRKEMTVTLTANPSHLESVDPVTEGVCRAKQDTLTNKNAILPILIHGDAAIAGQGIVYETFQLAKLPGYHTQGTVHVIVNNHIGFTTNPSDSRSTHYCSDIGKAFDLPIFHVNAEDVVGTLFVAKLAMQLRQKFHIDVIIDLNGYRKYGHNEGDEPTFTQPLEYGLIRSKESLYALFCQELVQAGLLSTEEKSEQESAFKESLQKQAQDTSSQIAQEKSLAAIQTHLMTGVSQEKILSLAKSLSSLAPTFKAHPKVAKLLQDREKQLLAPSAAIDWGTAEHLCFATLLDEHIPIRLSGQDASRGTFSHRHAVLIDQTTGERYIPLNHLHQSQASLHVYNSPLSEFAVLGFDFGYSIANPTTLTIWEAQFGDFANSAQVAIDQYISSSEQKWGVTSSITLLLPHGYEGQGPEHSSARIERYLQLAAEDNMRIVTPSLPSQLFHILREQGKKQGAKPLILFTPKALLRHPACVCSLSDLCQGKFQEVIEDPCAKEGIRSMLLCSGKVYYDLIEEKKRRHDEKTAIVRIEQLYPFPKERLITLLQAYQGLQTIAWVQEEPANMGAWSFIAPHIGALLGSYNALRYVGRKASASVAAGSLAKHKQELTELLNEAFQ